LTAESAIDCQRQPKRNPDIGQGEQANNPESSFGTMLISVV
jgi:hypothetical protein